MSKRGEFGYWTQEEIDEAVEKSKDVLALLTGTSAAHDDEIFDGSETVIIMPPLATRKYRTTPIPADGDEYAAPGHTAPLTLLPSAGDVSKYTEIPNGDKGQISDGYHTFNELYAHRCHLFLLLCLTAKDVDVFKTKKNDKREEWPGWFILGMNAPHGQITYHLPDSMWTMAARIQEIEYNAGYDGHTSADVLKRLQMLLALPVAERNLARAHTFELESMRVTIENLRAENDNLRTERDSLKAQLEMCEDSE